MDEADEGIHTRWYTKQLLMDVTNEGLPIQDDVQTTVDGWYRWGNPYQMMYKTTINVRDRWRNEYQMMYEATVDGWD